MQTKHLSGFDSEPSSNCCSGALPRSRCFFYICMLLYYIDMQTRSPQFSRLRQDLIRLAPSSPEELSPFLSSRPMVKGTVYPLRRKCSKTSCRCARGALHETVVLTASLGGKTRLWTIPEERIGDVRGQAEEYRRFRKARTALIKKSAQCQAKILHLIDAIEKIRTQQP